MRSTFQGGRRMEERKEFKYPEVISFDREEFVLETAFTGDPSDQQKPTLPPTSP
jgi:hypothetical protein